MEHPVVIRTDLRRARALVQAGFGTVPLQQPVAKQRRGHAIERRCLVESDEGVRVEPVPTDSVPAVDQDHPDVRMVDQSVRERHPRGTRADDEVVSLHSRTLATGPDNPRLFARTPRRAITVA